MRGTNSLCSFVIQGIDRKSKNGQRKKEKNRNRIIRAPPEAHGNDSVHGAWSTYFTKSRLPFRSTALKSALTSLLVAKAPHTLYLIRSPATKTPSIPTSTHSTSYTCLIWDVQTHAHSTSASRRQQTQHQHALERLTRDAFPKKRGGLEIPKTKLVAFYLHAGSIPIPASHQRVDVATNSRCAIVGSPSTKPPPPSSVRNPSKVFRLSQSCPRKKKPLCQLPTLTLPK